MAKKTVRVAVWEYRNAEGKRRLAYFGDSVDLTEDEIARGEAVDAFGADEPEVVETDEDPDTETDSEVVAEPAALPAESVRRPRSTATVEKWVEYAKAVGIPAADIEAMDNKDDIIAAVQLVEATEAAAEVKE